MLEAHAETVIARPTPQVFRFVADDFPETYPRWSPEVEELTVLSRGPIQPGWQARQVRIDKGRRTEATFQVSDYAPGRRIAFEGISRPFFIDYQFEPLGDDTRFSFSFELRHLDLIWRPFKGMIRSAIQDIAEESVKHVKAFAEAEISPNLEDPAAQRD